MHYYQVLVTQEYLASESVFTYEYDGDVSEFCFVSVPIQKKHVVGLVIRKTTRPKFKTKPIETVYSFGLDPIQRRLIRQLKDYYAATEAQVLQLFIPSFLAKIKSNDQPTTKSVAPKTSLPNVELTAEQQAALKTLRLEPNQTVLLHGVTGSGKTLIYLHRTADVVKNGGSALIMCPEIGLLPQLAAQFVASFGPDAVAIYHSALTTKQRAKIWADVAWGKVKILLGTRSALFLPLKNIQLIVIDESHEPAYKQEEGVRYHATRIASVLSQIESSCQLIIASATPLISDMYLAKDRNKPIISLNSPAKKTDLAIKTEVIDMKDRAKFNKHPMLSSSLLKQIEQTLASGEQALIYLNRRGTARLILCNDCGWQALCPVCDISLTYHHDLYELRCHTCGYKQPTPTICPECNSSEVIFKSAGTKALADWLQKHFKTAKVARFDTDNLSAESLQNRHAEIASGEIDILVGTQMLVKGLDLPKLSLVGIVSADLSLQLPDFSAEERTFQLIVQAMGRIGRGHRSGTTVIQTFNPNNSVIQLALTKNYDAFYTTQIEQRFRFNFPPKVFMAKLWCSKRSAASALQAANKLMPLLLKILPNAQFLGPVLSFHPKKNAHMTSQIVVKTANASDLRKLANQLPSGWQFDLEPINLL